MFKNKRRYLAFATATCGCLCFPFFPVHAASAAYTITNIDLSPWENIFSHLETMILVIAFGMIPFLLALLVNRFIKTPSLKKTWILRVFVFLIFLLLESIATPHTITLLLMRQANNSQLYPYHGGSYSPIALKPVIYLYPDKKEEVQVGLSYHGSLTTTYPAYDPSIKGWKVTAYPDGHLINAADHQSYSYLFWEGSGDNMKHDFSTGFVVVGKDTAAFLQKTLGQLGLTPKEYNEFIVYWLPKMENNPYNLIHFAGKEYTDTAPLEIDPKPDSLLRVFMEFKPLTEKIDLPPQKIAPFARKGFAVIEWGGTEVKPTSLID